MEQPKEEAGVYPYTRGIYPDMYRKRLWTMRQYAGYGSPKEANRRLKRLLAKGQTGLSVAFDLPTQLGMDPDDERALGEIGRTGVSIPALPSLESALQGIPLAEVSLSMTINATAPAIFAMAASVAERAGLSSSKCRGTVQNDMLKEYAARNLYVLPPEPSVRMAVDLIEFSCLHFPHWHPISVSGYHLREAGATAVQEIGFALANALYYLEETIKRGLDADRVAPRMSFFFAAGCNVIEETAKFRAARRLWARLVRERFGAKRQESWKMKFHAQTAGSELSSLEPDLNVIRVTLQAMAAVLGGAQSLHTNAKDEGLRLPTVQSATLALRTQQIVAFESGIAEYVDPLGGSHIVEELTDRLEQDALSIIYDIEARGGALQAVRSGYVQARIREGAYRHYEAFKNEKHIMVGVNRFRENTRKLAVSAGKNTFRSLDTERMVQALRAHREGRSQSEVHRAVHSLVSAADRGDNIMPAMFHAAKTGCTVGEMYGALTRLFGVHQENTDLEVSDEC